MLTSSRHTRASDPRAMTMSFRAKCRSPLSASVPAPPSRMIRPSIARRSSRRNSPAAMYSSRGSRSAASAFERKPTLPRLMPISGTSTSATARAARRNVPSPPRTTRASVVGSSRPQRIDVAGLGAPFIDAAPAAPTRGPRRELDGRFDRRVVGESDAFDRHAPTTSVMRSGEVRAAGSRRQVDEELAVAVLAGDRRRDQVSGPEAERSRVSSEALEDLAMDGRIADHATCSVRPFPASNCGFTRATMSARGASVLATGPRTLSREMNETSMTARPIGSGSVTAVSVRAFMRSIDVTRASRRNDSASWPRPTSRA